MTNEEISAQVTVLWKRVGTTEMASPHPLGYALDEEVFLLCQRLVSQAYEEAAQKAEELTIPGLDTRIAEEGERMAAEGGIPAGEAIPTSLTSQHRAGKSIAKAIRALKDSLAQETVST